jgi:hypothetical protein
MKKKQDSLKKMPYFYANKNFRNCSKNTTVGNMKNPYMMSKIFRTIKKEVQRNQRKTIWDKRAIEKARKPSIPICPVCPTAFRLGGEKYALGTNKAPLLLNATNCDFSIFGCDYNDVVCWGMPCWLCPLSQGAHRFVSFIEDILKAPNYISWN